MKNKKNVFITLCGLSPAVITEALWAMVQENYYPDLLIILTTERGREAILNENLKLILSQMKKEFHIPNEKWVFGAQSVRVIPDEKMENLKDIHDENDSEATADFLLQEFRKYMNHSYGRVDVSLAGGRKSMSALAALCFSLAARENDRLFHTLVSHPFDSPVLKPRFYYPQEGLKHYLNDNEVNSSEAQIKNCYIPTVKLSQISKEKINESDQYSSLVNYSNNYLKKLLSKKLIFNKRNLSLTLDGEEIFLQKQVFQAYYTIVKSQYEKQAVASDDNFLEKSKVYFDEYLSDCSSDNIRKIYSMVNKALSKKVDKEQHAKLKICRKSTQRFINYPMELIDFL